MEEEEKEEEKKKEGDVSLWQQSLDSPIYLLQRAASKYNIAIVLINEAETTPDCSYEQTQSPTVGNIILDASKYRLSFKNRDSYKVARIIHSPYHPEGEATFTIEGEGVTDVHR
jgi:DNA repair protein RadA